MQETKKPDIGIFRIDTGLTNEYVIGTPRGNILIDTSFPDRGKSILDQIEGFGLPRSIRAIIVTHGHLDHWGSVKELVDLTGAEVVMHERDWMLMTDGVDMSFPPIDTYGRFLGLLNPRTKKEKAPDFEPTTVIRKGLSLKKYGLVGRIVHAPGHTPGSIIVHLDGGIVITGDTIMGRPPFWDRPSLPLVAWHRESLVRSVRSIARSKPKMVLSAHGGPFNDLDDLERRMEKEFRAMKPIDPLEI